MDRYQACRILKLAATADAATIKKAYRVLAHQCHPDKNPSEEALNLFRQATEAYNFLIVNFARGSDLSSYAAAVPPKPPTRKASPEPLSPDDLFEDLFGLAQRDRILARQFATTVPLTLDQWHQGGERTGTVTYLKMCRECQGSGAQSGSHATICTYCFGSGQIKLNEGAKILSKICTRCQGIGRKILKPCPACQGLGWSKNLFPHLFSLAPRSSLEEPIEVTGRQRFSNHRHTFFVMVTLREHDYFKIANLQVLCQLPVSEDILKNGGVVNTPTIWGQVDLQLAAGLKDGRVVTLPNYGLPGENDKRGEQCVTIVAPDNSLHAKVTKKYHRILQRLRQGRLGPKNLWRQLLGD